MNLHIKTYRPVSLRFVLYECETWSMKLALGCSKDRVLRMIGRSRKGITCMPDKITKCAIS
jgi:hypothetical protein